MLNVIMLSVVMLIVVMLSVVVLSVVMLSVFMLSVVILSVVILSVIMLSVNMLNVVAPIFSLFLSCFVMGQHTIAFTAVINICQCKSLLPWAQCYKTFYIINLRMFVIS